MTVYLLLLLLLPFFLFLLVTLVHIVGLIIITIVGATRELTRDDLLALVLALTFAFASSYFFLSSLLLALTSLLTFLASFLYCFSFNLCSSLASSLAFFSVLLFLRSSSGSTSVGSWGSVPLHAVDAESSLLSVLFRSKSSGSTWTFGAAAELPLGSILHAVRRIRSNAALIPLVGSLEHKGGLEGRVNRPAKTQLEILLEGGAALPHYICGTAAPLKTIEKCVLKTYVDSNQIQFQASCRDI